MALASQTVRSTPIARASDQSRRSNGLLRGKRVVGVLMLAGVCGAMVLWGMKARDGGGTVGKNNTLGPAGAAAATGAGGGANGGGSNIPDTTPAATSLLATDPHGKSTPAAEPKSMVMGAKEPPVQTPTGTPSLTPNPPTSPTSPTTTPPAPGTNPTGKPGNTITEPGTGTPGGATPGTPGGQTTTTDMNAGGSGGYAGVMAAAERAIGQQRLVEARNMLNRALVDSAYSAADRANIRKKMSELNQTLVFGPAQVAGDPLSESYKVVAGDKLNKIYRKLSLLTEPSLMARVNKLANPNALRVGQDLKVIRGPFHAVVTKSAYRMDIYAGPTPSPTSIGTSNLPDGIEPGWTYICSFPVGLGAQGLTPVGNFTIKEGSKLINPHWANPRTGEKFAADDPKNPIGERWMGLEGLTDKSKGYTGYGIHGTIDPDSVGKEMSMGCVRMASGDVEIVYELLTGRVSVVKIVP